MLDAHFIAGDGRVNENIGLTAIHQVFHSEHDRLVDDIKTCCQRHLGQGIARWPSGSSARRTAWNGERLFQAARFVTEMEYQHLVFEEFARKIQPAINPFEPFAFTQTGHQPGGHGRVRPRRLPVRPLDADRDDLAGHDADGAATSACRCSTASSTRRRTPTAARRAR